MKRDFLRTDHETQTITYKVFMTSIGLKSVGLRTHTDEVEPVQKPPTIILR